VHPADDRVVMHCVVFGICLAFPLLFFLAIALLALPQAIAPLSAMENVADSAFLQNYPHSDDVDCIPNFSAIANCDFDWLIFNFAN
jgi:hypothetical protein